MTVVFDASAVLAMLLQEPGSDRARDALLGSRMVAVNQTEVIDRLTRDTPVSAALATFDALAIAVDPATPEIARAAGAMRPFTRAFGLSLGDRFCLAYGRSQGATVLTADSRWREVADALGVEVVLIR